MFRKARKALHKELEKYVFVLVVRGVTVPPDCVIHGEVTHYYTTAEELSVSPSRSLGTVWVKKKGRRSHQRLGPLTLKDSGVELPKAGDILMGELQVDKASERQFGRQKFVAERQSFKWWINYGAPLYYLATMVLKGTSETETSLRKLLKLPGDYDDVWMLARVVLFNNVRGFVDMLDPSKKDLESVKLQEGGPVQFVQQLSVWLDDFSIMTEFQKLVPSGLPQGVPSGLPQSRDNNDIPPLSAAPAYQSDFVGRRRTTRASTLFVEEYNPDFPGFHSSSGPIPPRSPQYAPNTPPYSPQYAPNTPPHSPQYAPNSPPRSPQYAPNSPPYAPNSPPYAPQPTAPRRKKNKRQTRSRSPSTTPSPSYTPSSPCQKK